MIDLQEEVLFKIRINNKRKEKKLDLSGYGLTEIPIEVFELTHLESLILGDWLSENRNKISIIPSEIKKLTNLKKIDLRCNKLEKFPLIFCELESLEIIDLNSNLISNIPNDINRLVNLKELVIFK